MKSSVSTRLSQPGRENDYFKGGSFVEVAVSQWVSFTYCGSPLPISDVPGPVQSARGLAQSKTIRE